ncbi:MAG: nucleoside kinase, partial [Acetatifactor sp.]|nr:nucleoside kinase [Acetatifactor sp.]
MKIEVLGQEREYPQGITYEQIAADYQEQYGGLIALACANGKLRELFKHANRDCKLEFFTLKDTVGHKAYVRSATMLCLKAIYDTMGEKAAAMCRMEFAVGNGTYISTGREIASTENNAERIKARMDELQAMAMPFRKKSYPLDEAIDLFRAKGMTGKTELFRYRRSSFVNVYEMDGYYDYYYGFMLPNAGYVKWYDLQAYDEGFMLVLPEQKNPTQVEPLEERRKLFETLKASAQWGHEIGIETVGQLNNQICSGSISDLILVQEAEQERKISEIAREITSRKGVKFIMIAGPSSSGKTSLSHRLSIQLRTFGMTPHPIALDNYFVNREDTPLDENGDYNFECLEAIDVKQFNNDMIKLLAGERVQIPDFNFKIGRREYSGNYMQLGKEDVLVIEGIHGLNPKMSYALPEESKFKIYISALTSLNIDDHNRIPTTD